MTKLKRSRRVKVDLKTLEKVARMIDDRCADFLDSGWTLGDKSHALAKPNNSVTFRFVLRAPKVKGETMSCVFTKNVPGAAI